MFHMPPIKTLAGLLQASKKPAQVKFCDKTMPELFG